MNTVFARALVALTLVAVPASALASTKETKADKAKHETKAEKPKHGHARAHIAVAKKEPPPKKSKHGSHRVKNSTSVAAAPGASAANSRQSR